MLTSRHSCAFILTHEGMQWWNRYTHGASAAVCKSALRGRSCSSCSALLTGRNSGSPGWLSQPSASQASAPQGAWLLPGDGHQGCGSQSVGPSSLGILVSIGFILKQRCCRWRDQDPLIRACYCQRAKLHSPKLLSQSPPRDLHFSGGWSNWCAM